MEDDAYAAFCTDLRLVNSSVCHSVWAVSFLVDIDEIVISSRSHQWHVKHLDKVLGTLSPPLLPFHPQNEKLPLLLLSQPGRHSKSKALIVRHLSRGLMSRVSKKKRSARHGSIGVLRAIPPT